MMGDPLSAIEQEPHRYQFPIGLSLEIRSWVATVLDSRHPTSPISPPFALWECEHLDLPGCFFDVASF